MNHTLPSNFNNHFNDAEFNKFASEIQAKAYESALFTANEARTMLYNALAERIDNYYEEYEPKIYSRTYAFRDKSHKGFVNKRANKWVSGGVVVSADKIPTDNYGADVDFGDGSMFYVDDAWEVTEANMQGYHGGAYLGIDIDASMQVFLKSKAKKIEKIYINDFMKRINTIL